MAWQLLRQFLVHPFGCGQDLLESQIDRAALAFWHVQGLPSCFPLQEGVWISSGKWRTKCGISPMAKCREIENQRVQRHLQTQTFWMFEWIEFPFNTIIAHYSMLPNQSSWLPHPLPQSTDNSNYFHVIIKMLFRRHIQSFKAGILSSAKLIGLAFPSSS